VRAAKFLSAIAPLLIILLALDVRPASSAERVAFVIGNGAYAWTSKLRNPLNDANDMAKVLRDMGFDVVVGTDLTRQGMEQKIREFARKLVGAQIGLFFYAGHGMQVNGQNYLIPTDAKLEQAGDLALDTIDIQVVLKQMETQSRVNLIFLDACRDNPLTRSYAELLGPTRSGGVARGLATIPTSVGTMIAFATQPGNVAVDGSGRNSPFTTALLQHIRTPGLDIGVLMRRVRSDVIAATSERQVPWDHSSLTDSVILAPDRPTQTSNPKGSEPLQKSTRATSEQSKQSATNAVAGADPPVIYSPWTKYCGTDGNPEAKEVCLTVKEARLETGQFLAGAAVIEQQGEAKKLLRITLPLGMQLPQGTRMLLDKEPPLQGRFIVCMPNGCMADFDVNSDFIAKMKRGQQITMQGINLPGQAASYMLPLTDFAKAHEGPPTDPKKLEEQQKQLQDELQKKAEEARQRLLSNTPSGQAK